MTNRSILFALLCIAVLFGSSLTGSAISNSAEHSYMTRSIISSIERGVSNEEWVDGSINGTWGPDETTIQGTFHGSLTFGRTARIGTFSAEWSSIDNASSGTVHGRFWRKLLIGTSTTAEERPTLCVGTILAVSETKFTATLVGPHMPLTYIKGDHESSFLPPLPGPYGVGVTTLHLIDESRPELFTPDDPDDLREMMVQLWYPIDYDILTPRVDYMDAPTFAWLKDRSPVPLITIPDAAYLFVRPHGRFNVTLANDEPHYPILIFSPGYNGVYQIYTSLIENLASCGYIIASINHPYVSGITVFPDGREIYVSPDPPSDIGLRSVVEDAKFVLDTITEMNVSDPLLQGICDLSRVGMYGHSYGGAATALCCAEDERFQCGLTLDGVFYLDEMPQGITQPFLLQLADKRFNDANVQDMWNNYLHSDAYIVEIAGTTHSGFTDVGVLLNHLVPLIPPRLLGFGTIPPKRHVNITRSFEQVFFDVYLKNRPVEDLSALADLFDDVTFEVK